MFLKLSAENGWFIVNTKNLVAVLPYREADRPCGSRLLFSEDAHPRTGKHLWALEDPEEIFAMLKGEG